MAVTNTRESIATSLARGRMVAPKTMRKTPSDSTVARFLITS